MPTDRDTKRAGLHHFDDAHVDGAYVHQSKAPSPTPPPALPPGPDARAPVHRPRARLSVSAEAGWMSRPLRVFISYSHHSSEHRARVRALADRLRADGVEALLDQGAGEPSEGWPNWMERQILRADYILVVTRGDGAMWEGELVEGLLYKRRITADKIIPVAFDSEPVAAALRLQAYTIHRLPADYDALYRRITSRPATPANA